MTEKGALRRNIASVLLTVLSVVYLVPILLILINSFKGNLYISDQPFTWPSAETFVGLTNYATGIEKTNFISAMWWSFFITVVSTAVIVLFTSMTGWYITRVKAWWAKAIYYLLVFSMVVPFQMVMFPMSKLADMMGLANPVGIIVLYLGFGAGLSSFMFSGFVKSIPVELEEAALIDGCGPIRTFFKVVFPILKPTAITVTILNVMWIWNDFLLPYLVLDQKYKTIPIAVQYLKGGYGSVDKGAMMGILVLAIIPIIVFYLSCQKHIIKGVVAGAVKG